MKRKAAVIWVSALGAAVVLSLLLFIRQYQHLGETIERERITYVSEIKNQMVRNIEMEKDVQMSMVDLYSRLIKKTDLKQFPDLKALLDGMVLDDKDTIFLMDANGFIYNLDGERKKVSDNKLAESLLVEGQPVFSTPR